MPKRLFKRLAPSAEAIRDSRCLRVFGAFIHDPNLWHLNRHAVARAFAVGLFWTLIPVPFQMVFAAGVAILWRANIPLSVSLVWLTNPVTIPPVFFFTYKLGAWLLGSPSLEVPEHLNAEWFLDSLGLIWTPLFVGSLLAALVASGAGFYLVHAFWRWQTVKRYRRRRLAVSRAGTQAGSGG